MGELKNIFSWSKSRDLLFNECKRKYYLNHYGFWGGWEWNASEELREIYMLKKIISKEVWIGQVIHNLIKHILLQLKSGNDLPLEYSLSILKKRLEKDYERSEKKLYLKGPKDIVGLFEHEYGLLVLKERWEQLFRSAEQCLINFYNSDIYQKIKKIPKENWVFLEDFLGFNFEDTQIYLSIDFAIKQDNKIILYDWKTGKENNEQEKIQLGCYALFVLNRWNILPENITAIIYNLNVNKEEVVVIDPKLIEKTKEYIKKSIKDMQELLFDKKENIAKKESFLREEGTHCKWCNFRKICLEGGD